MIIEKKETSSYPPLVIPAVLFICGIILGSIITSYFYFISSVILLSGFIVFYHIKHHISVKPVFIFLIIFFTGFVSIIPRLPESTEKGPVAEYFGVKNIHIAGMVVSKPVRTNIRTKFVLKIHTLRQKNAGKTKDVNRKIEVYSYRDTPALEYGDIIRFTGSIVKPRNFLNPHGFDYEKYLAFKDVTGVSFTSGRKIRLEKRINRCSLSIIVIRKINNLRGGFEDFLKKSMNDPDAFSIICALTTGLKNHIPEETRLSFAKTGTAHILAISGLHLSIIAFISFSVFNFLFSFIKPLLIRGLSARFAALATLFPLIVYSSLSGFSPSTKRAFIMIAIYMLSFVIKREKDVLNSLAAAALVILIIDPAAVFAVSFQLSFSAVLFIILGINAAGNISFFQKKNLITKFAMFMVVSFSAGLGTMPVVMYYFNMVSFVQLFANVVIIPVMGFVVVPLGLAAFLAFPFSHVFSSLFIEFAMPFLSFSISFAEYLSSFSFTWSRCVTPHLIEIVCCYAFISGLYFWVIKKKGKAVFVVIAALIIFITYSGYMLHQRYFSNELKITALDVGQGSSALIEGPNGERILVDGGGASYSSSFDTGRYIVAPFLWYKKIASLDAVILTHPERDHMNGLIYIVENFKVKKFIKNSDTRDTENYMKLMRLCSKKNIPLINFLHKTEQRIDIGELNLSFFFPITEKKNMDNIKKSDYNNNSLVFIIRYKDFKILFPGDIMEKTETKLVRTYSDKLKADILMAPHHGSHTSSTSAFLESVKPENIIISCGFKNRYNFPDKKVIKRYKAKNIRFFRTDSLGAVEIVSDGRDYNITTLKGD